MIVLCTDFGLAGPYIGQLQAILHRQAPGVPVVSLFADLAAFDIEAAAYLLPAYAGVFAPDTVFLCVVDPGVGSARPGVIAEIDNHWFVGPNEGLFAVLARRAQTVRCWQLALPENASPSFHGRDVFAPAAARLARGGGVSGESTDPSSLLRPGWPDELWRVAYVDHYGNAITGLRAAALEVDAVLVLDGYLLKRARTFSDMSEGLVYWYENANGLVEFAMNRGRADAALGIQVGTTFST
jgi:S-adenosyl-L-methionine hydrolase (adenosine-forming)